MKKKSIETGVKIVAKNPNQHLHKEQIAFNKLSEKIEHQKQLNAKKTLIADTVLEQFGKVVKPLEKEQAIHLIKCAMEIDFYLSKTKSITKAQKKDLTIVLLTILDESFELAKPDLEAVALYDKYNDTTYEQDVQNQTLEEKEMFLEMLNIRFGKKFKLAELEDTKEAQQKLFEKISNLEEAEEQKEKKLEEKQANKKPQYPPKKQTKQQEKEAKREAERIAKQKEEDAIQQKSMRSIYLDLVKVLHPDTEMNEDEKLWKQELMKEVTVAYNEKNLMHLLDIEMKWLNKQGNYLANISVDKIKIFNNVLRKQLQELEHKGFIIYRHPRYEGITDCFAITVAASIKRVAERASHYKNLIENLKDIEIKIQRNQFTNTKKLINYLEDHFLEDDNNDDDFDNFFNSLFG
jgi:hypothetical protein